MTGQPQSTAGTASPASAPSSAAWGLLAVAIVLLNVGNVVLEATFKGQPLVLDMFFRPGFVVAVGCLGISFFIYVKVLATLPLAVAYPVMVGVSLLIVAAVGYFWFGIDLSPGQLAGIGIVFAGVTLISRSSRTSVQERVIE